MNKTQYFYPALSFRLHNSSISRRSVILAANSEWAADENGKNAEWAHKSKTPAKQQKMTIIRSYFLHGTQRECELD
jgi:hypothetical protein